MNPWPSSSPLMRSRSPHRRAADLWSLSRRCAAPRRRPTRSSANEAQEPAPHPARPRDRRGARARCCSPCRRCSDQAAYFYTPADIAAGKAVPVGKAVRIGGMVEKGSVQHLPDGVTIDFIVARRDQAHDSGRLPRHPARSVPRGQRRRRRRAAPAERPFVADEILAKHDENYMPPQLGTSQREHKTDRRWSGDRRSRPRPRSWLAATAVAAPAVSSAGAALRPAASERLAARRVAADRGRAGHAALHRLRCALIWLFAAHRSVGRAGRREQPQRQALALQIRRRLGESRRLDAALGDGARRRRRRLRAVRAAPGERTLDRHPRRPGGDRRSASTLSC